MRKVKSKQITFHKKYNLNCFEMSLKASYNFYEALLCIIRLMLKKDDVVFVSEPAPPPPMAPLDVSLPAAHYHDSIALPCNLHLPEDCEYATDWDRRCSWLTFIWQYKACLKQNGYVLLVRDRDHGVHAHALVTRCIGDGVMSVLGNDDIVRFITYFV